MAEPSPNQLPPDGRLKWGSVPRFRKVAVAALLAFGAIAVTTCAIPAAKPASSDPGAMDALARGCRQCPARDALAQVAGSPEQLAFARRIAAIETVMTGRPLSGGNSVELLRDGPATHDAQLAAIAHAKDHVHLITYIMTDDKLAHRYLKALADRARAGVKVRLMFDAVGGRTVGPEYRQALSDAGIQVKEFGPFNPLKSNGRNWETSHRHHRKILVVDGRIAFTGGVNISDEYRSSSSGSGRVPGWRDTNIRVEGPAVAEFQRLFFDSWAEDGHAPIPDGPCYWPKLAPRGHSYVRAVKNDGNDLLDTAVEPLASLVRASKDRPENSIYASYVAAMSAAQKHIWITQAYFIPNGGFLDVLAAAARRGVDVRLLVPSTRDIKLMVQASRFYYTPLLDAGARVYEYSGPMLHAKTAVIDGVWSTVGSSNLDYRSFIHNDEANAIVLGQEFAGQMEQMFLDDLAHAHEITAGEWAQRGWANRARQRMAVLLKYWI